MNTLSAKPPYRRQLNGRASRPWHPIPGPKRGARPAGVVAVTFQPALALHERRPLLRLSRPMKLAAAGGFTSAAESSLCLSSNNRHTTPFVRTTLRSRALWADSRRSDSLDCPSPDSRRSSSHSRPTCRSRKSRSYPRKGHSRDRTPERSKCDIHGAPRRPPPCCRTRPRRRLQRPTSIGLFSSRLSLEKRTTDTTPIGVVSHRTDETFSNPRKHSPSPALQG